MNKDYEIAKELQYKYYQEESPQQIDKPNDYLNSTQNLVNPEWEHLDPTPDVHKLFTLFGRKFFQNKLVCVTLEWSKKMYSCAGICYQRRSGMGMECTIRLSEPLLKLRPRKDLVETLLHEMIHAYCFVLGIREGNGGHGPHFVKIMTGINRLAGTNITVYHTFHDEVDLYKTHWWRCDGVCQNRKPFYGFVKRTCNRAPGPHDFWYGQHQATCGGTFIKVKEPESKKGRKGKENKGNEVKASVKPANSDIRKFFVTSPKADKSPFIQPHNHPKTFNGARPNFGGNTVVVRKPQTKVTRLTSPTSKKSPRSTPSNQSRISTIHGVNSNNVPNQPIPVPSSGGNLTNVQQFKDLNDKTVKNKVSSPSGSGNQLGGGKRKTSRLLDEYPESPPKRSRNTNHESDSEIIEIKQPAVETVAVSDSDDEKEQKAAFVKALFDDDDFDDVVLIDNEFDDNYLNDGNDDLIANSECLDTSVIDDLFNVDTLLEKFQKDAVIKMEENEVICPLCMSRIERCTMNEHFETCPSLEMIDATQQTQPAKTVEMPSVNYESPQPSTSTGITHDSRRNVTNVPLLTIKSPPSFTSTPIIRDTRQKVPCNTTAVAAKDNNEEMREMLRSCGYTEEDILTAMSSRNSPSPAPDETQTQKDKKEVAILTSAFIEDDEDFLEVVSSRVDFLDELKPCPVCNRKVQVKDLNTHLDDCLLSNVDLSD